MISLKLQTGTTAECKQIEFLYSLLNPLSHDDEWKLFQSMGSTLSPKVTCADRSVCWFGSVFLSESVDAIENFVVYR
jgi:hypothetical protein